MLSEDYPYILRDLFQFSIQHDKYAGRKYSFVVLKNIIFNLQVPRNESNRTEISGKDGALLQYFLDEKHQHWIIEKSSKDD